MSYFTTSLLLIMKWIVCLDSLLWHRNRSCTTTYELMNIMDIRSCCVVVAMVTLKEHQMFDSKCEGIICDTPSTKEGNNSQNPNDFSNCLDELAFKSYPSLTFLPIMGVTKMLFLVLTLFKKFICNIQKRVSVLPLKSQRDFCFFKAVSTSTYLGYTEKPRHIFWKMLCCVYFQNALSSTFASVVVDA